MLLHEALTREILGAYYRVYSALGFGFLEAVYANAMVVELGRSGIACEREAQVDVRYQGAIVGRYRADLLVEDKIVLELKATPSLDPSSRQQLLNYLRATELEVGLLLHFGPRPSFQRVIASNAGVPSIRANPDKSV